MIRTVMVPVDGSPFAEHALPAALAIARRGDGRLRVVRVHEIFPPAYGGSPSLAERVDEAIMDRERVDLDDVARRLPPSFPVTTELLDGEIVPALARRAAECDLVVMSTHGHGPLVRFWLGSVADELMRVLPVPLLLVRPVPIPPDLTGGVTFRQILVPLDGTPAAEQILAPVADLAKLFGAAVLLTRVVKPLLIERPAPAEEAAGKKVRTLLDELREEQHAEQARAESYLGAVAGRLAGQGLTVRSRILVAEQPAGAMLREAEIGGADLIALATHGRHGLPRLLVGSVADKLIRASNLPVLTLHRQDQ
jgi:nucleotide-binding universal stress UspA family protein